MADFNKPSTKDYTSRPYVYSTISSFFISHNTYIVVRQSDFIDEFVENEMASQTQPLTWLFS
ncbi:unnamed protein product [Lupinus luteus]|uniref:Uncharacterized protein n=1 Tax=Lupinus luteus TaxID=3873 RepID=A0AAV1XME6_LUPLU